LEWEDFILASSARLNRPQESQLGWYAFRRQRQEDHEFKARLGYIVSLEQQDPVSNKTKVHK
jgi:hypothetical protein